MLSVTNSNRTTSSTKSNTKRRGNPLKTEAALVFQQEQKREKEPHKREYGVSRSPADSFLIGALLHHEASAFIHAFYSKQKRRALWHNVCQNSNLMAPLKPFEGSSSSTERHFNDRAAMVVEESIHCLSSALANRWLDQKSVPWGGAKTSGVKFYASPKSNYNLLHHIGRNEDNNSECTPIFMELTRRSLDERSMIVYCNFQLPENSPGFTRKQLFHLRHGTIVECSPMDGKGGLQSVLLGVIGHTNRYAAEKELSFKVLMAPQCLTRHLECTRWSIQPITSLVSELRQLETCQMIKRGQTKLPFLRLLNGQKKDIVALQQQQEDIRPISPKSVAVDLANTTLPIQWDLPKLNEIQEKAAIHFLNSNHGTISLVQGPPGTGKTTFLISTICQYLLRTTVTETKNEDSSTIQTNSPKALMVAAPSNKAVSVVASRFMAATASAVYDGKGKSINVVLVGDEDKLTEGETVESILNVQPAFFAEASARASRATHSIFVYKFLPSLVASFQCIQRYIESNKEECATIPRNNVAFRFLAQLLEIGHVFKAGVSGRAKKLRQGLLRMNGNYNNPQKHNETVLDLLKEVLSDVVPLVDDYKKADMISRALIRRADVIFCTLATAGGAVFKSREQPFRIRDLIVDEASAATEPELAIPFHLQPNRLLAVGDPMQLPATVQSPNAKQFGLDKSLHQRLMMDCQYPYTLLEQQYRMRPEISQFASRQFYNGKLKDSGKVMRSSYVGPVSLLESSSDSFLFQEVNGKEERKGNGSFQNHAEAKAVVERIHQLKAKASATDPDWFRDSKVRIITFYSAQVNLINSMLSRQLGFGHSKSGLVAATVDSSQGCEADIVIVSFVRTCHLQSGKASRIAGFLADDRRINVALTRSKYELICIGSPGNMIQNPTIPTLQSLAQEAQSRGCVGGTTAIGAASSFSPPCVSLCSSSSDDTQKETCDETKNEKRKKKKQRRKENKKRKSEESDTSSASKRQKDEER